MMASMTIDLWACTRKDMEILQKTLENALRRCSVKIKEEGAVVWQNTGNMDEDTRVGYRPARSSDAGNPTLRYMARLILGDSTTGCPANEELRRAVEKLPEGSFMHGSGIVIARQSKAA